MHTTQQNTKQHSKKITKNYLVSQQCLSISPKLLVHIWLTVVVMLVVDFSKLDIYDQASFVV